MSPNDDIGSGLTKPLLVALLLLVLTLGATSAAPDGHPQGGRPAGVDCAGFRQMQGVGAVCPTSGGLWEVFSRDGRSLGTTHGPDPVPASASEHGAGVQTAPAQPPLCTSNPSTDYHGVVIYARAHDDTDRYASIAPQLRDEVAKANTHLRIDAGTFDIQADYKMRCQNGVLEVFNAVLPTSRAAADFSTIIDDLMDMGYDNQRVKYWVWYDDTGACTCGGIGHRYDDDRLVLDNFNNGHPNAVPMFGVTFGHMDYTIMMHENGHNMGAVQDSAPHSTKAGHCTDGRDIMCYDDGGPKGRSYTSGTCTGRDVFDCNHDDYFHPAPPAGSYLATKWNIGSTLNRFVTYGPCGLAREGTILLPGAGASLFGATSATETGISSDCWGRDFVLWSTYATGDFDVCFYQGQNELECHREYGHEAGTVPVGTTEARIALFSGALEQYTLWTP